MSEDPRHPWGTGATRYQWVAPVDRVIQQVRRRWPRAVPNTYVCHPWCGWSRYSVDWWGAGGRGDPLSEHVAKEIRAYVMGLDGAPYIRHTILQHQLWTSWGGYSYWSADDHDGRLQHLHVTYWR